MEQKEQLIANRFVNLQGGKNNNIALDEYLEMLNRDSKIASRGHQTKESIITHSKDYPLLVNMTKHFEVISNCGTKKGFHHLPSYVNDVQKVTKDLMQKNLLHTNSTLKCKGFKVDRNPYEKCESGLPTLILRHTPDVPFHRLRGKF